MLSDAASASVAKRSQSLHLALQGHETTLDALREIGADFHDRGWSLGTSSNYSVVIEPDPLELIVTASGRDKSRLTRHDFVRVGDNGLPVAPDQPKSSAETLLHVAAAVGCSAGAILHTHSVWSTILSEYFFAQGHLELSGFEMLKGLSGVTTHESIEKVLIFENTQDIPALAENVREKMGSGEITHGFLIRRHGLYTWGRDLDDARRQIEIFEFLFECLGRELSLPPRPEAPLPFPRDAGVDEPAAAATDVGFDDPEDSDADDELTPKP